jgi:hypothetical protein
MSVYQFPGFPFTEQPHIKIVPKNISECPKINIPVADTPPPNLSLSPRPPEL